MTDKVQKRILIVEDEPMNTKILKNNLQGVGYKTVCVENGVEAMEVLHKDQRFDLILLDRMMPEMDGMEVLKNIQADKVLKNIPVIMQTAAAATDQIQKGIEAGVFYYLTKPFTVELLLAIVQSAIDDKQFRDSLVGEVSKVHQSLGLIDAVNCRFQTLDEAQNLSYLLANCCPDPEKTILGLSELMVNAIEHGNLGITYEEKKQLMLSNSWHKEVGDRLKHSEFSKKQAKVEFIRNATSIDICITDEGDGFDYKSYLEFDAHRATDPNGRGIILAKKLSFDEVDYVNAGNIVKCSISLKDDK